MSSRRACEVSFQELFAVDAGGSGDDGYLLDGDLLDLEPALRDALVLELPLSPLCRATVPGCAASAASGSRTRSLITVIPMTAESGRC